MNLLIAISRFPVKRRQDNSLRVGFGHRFALGESFNRPAGSVDRPDCRFLRRNRSRAGIERCAAGGVILRRHLHTHQHQTVRMAVVAVVEQRDIPAIAHGVEKLQQRARAARETRRGTELPSPAPAARPPTMCRTCSLAISLRLISSTS